MKMTSYKGLLAIAGVLMVTIVICTDARRTKSKSSDLCSQGYTCKLKSKTRDRIESSLDDNGASFDDCFDKCTENLRGKPRTRHRRCECYCSMFHDPCPTEQPIVNGTSIIDDQFQCFETLAETCSQLDDMENSKSIKTKTIRKLFDIDVNITSEDCQEECVEMLLTKKDRSRTTKGSTKKQEISESLCSCFCLYHQVCLPGQTTAPVTPISEVESTSHQPTNSTIMFDLPQ